MSYTQIDLDKLSRSAQQNRRLGAVFPVTNILVILVAGLIAYQLIPEQAWQYPGALVLSGMAISLGLLFCVAMAVLRSPLALLRAEMVVMTGMVYWLTLDPIQASYGLMTSREGVERMIISITLFATCFWLGVAFTSRRAHGPWEWSSALRDVKPRFLFWSALGCGLAGLSYKTLSCHFDLDCLYEGFVSPRFTAYFEDTSFSALKRLRPIGLLALPLTVAYFIIVRRVSLAGALLAALSAFLLWTYLMGDGRRIMGAALAAGTLVYVLLRPRITAKHMTIVALLLALTMLILEAMLAWRGYGFGRALFEGRPIETRPGLVAVDKNFFHGSRAMAIVPAAHPHTGWRGLSYHLGNLIPRSLFPRPAKFGFDYSGVTERKGRAGWTATFSLIGDLWIIGGFVAITLGGFAYGMMANLASRLLLRPVSVRDRLLYAAVVLALLVSLRSLHELVTMGLGAAALWSFLRFKDALWRGKLTRQAVLGPLLAHRFATR